MKRSFYIKITNKKLSSIILASACSLLLSAPIFATWYSSDITLPRTGSWISSVTRQATDNNQETKVTNNDYLVKGRIILAGSEQPLSSWVNHPKQGSSNYGSVFVHNTNTSLGDNLKVEFKTQVINFRTVTATLAWRP